MQPLSSNEPIDPSTDARFALLKKCLDGELHTDRAMRRIYSTDASIYQELPAAVAIPKTENDIFELIRFANQNRIGLIPRTAGTSLAGQVVGNGIVIDVSRHFSKIIEVDKSESWVRVQPGVIRDELNTHLAKHGLYFAPETSTSNRAMIGGMLGNNSCGANSIVSGSLRDHVIEVSGFLSDGSRATFGPLSQSELNSKCGASSNSLETSIYRAVISELSAEDIQQEIEDRFPKRSIKRRNTGYAIDALIQSEPFGGTEPFNLAKLIAGSEGTLFFATEVKLNCVKPPPTDSAVICPHFENIQQALLATGLAMQHSPSRCELVDKFVIEGARRNLLLARCMDFVVGKPEAMLLIEFRHEQSEVIDAQTVNLIDHLKRAELGYAFPVLQDVVAAGAWAVRKSGLGFINNQQGNLKPVTVIEDSALDLDDLPAFVAEVDDLLQQRFDVSCVHYGHAGAGELHLRPNLDLNQSGNRQKLRDISCAVAGVVKKFRGSLSGEHGDGRLRSEHIQFMIGDKCYRLLERIKAAWDPNNVFNPGKIVQAPPMDVAVRHFKGPPVLAETVFRFADSGDLLSAANMCSGSGDCRKTHLAGGTMCPSYRATRNEYDSTRARANLLRQMLSNSSARQLFENKKDADEVKKILDLCLSCKGCKNECPSNVDLAKIKAEFMQGYHDAQGTPIRTKALARFERWSRRASRFSRSVNFISSNRLTSGIVKRALGIHSNRSLPKLAPTTLRRWFAGRKALNSESSNGKVILFCDEFTNFFDVHIGKAAIELLELLGYDVVIADHVESGRSAISAGLPHEAKKLAVQNVQMLSQAVSEGLFLIGIEPSAILTIRDEYPDLVDQYLADAAARLADRTLLIDEFLSTEFDNKRFTSERFVDRSGNVLLHGHCHQKAISSIEHTRKILEIPAGLDVQVIDSGCCGMAGFFGYQSDKYELSQQIGELVLLPTIRAAPASTIIAATGTSCRHQILDGTSRKALHPVEILRDRVKFGRVKSP